MNQQPGEKTNSQIEEECESERKSPEEPPRTCYKNEQKEGEEKEAKCGTDPYNSQQIESEGHRETENGDCRKITGECRIPFQIYEVKVPNQKKEK